MNELPESKDGDPVSPGSSRFGVTGGNLICGGGLPPSTPERIAERRAYAEKRLLESTAFTRRMGAEVGRRVIHFRFKKSKRRKLWRTVSWWRSCIDKMKNGDVGMRAEWAMQNEEIVRGIRESIERFKDINGQPYFEQEE